MNYIFLLRKINLFYHKVFSLNSYNLILLIYKINLSDQLIQNTYDQLLIYLRIHKFYLSKIINNLYRI